VDDEQVDQEEQECVQEYREYVLEQREHVLEHLEHVPGQNQSQSHKKSSGQYRIWAGRSLRCEFLEVDLTSYIGMNLPSARNLLPMLVFTSKRT